ncbi:STM4015 family protein [Streptomyces niveiscabiei]|uniref:STM4015 family protein n=1 Tax=Streptomyces niveiscabiei TaxID=164115 RepID=UPI0029B7E19B|nr:STM4015 family protein [Streptomyces niveiscabiei]MDX3383935.1 STM4015 family protein [Streptomyces niveiscabiei]
MTVHEHLKTFHELPVHAAPHPKDNRRQPAADSVAWRVASHVYDHDHEWTDAFARFLDSVDSTQVKAIVVGAWEEAYETDPAAVIEAIIAAKDRLPALRALFLGDMTSEECEISWINQTDVTPLLTAFPELEELGTRGGQGLSLDAVAHRALRRLTMESGGLPAAVVRGVAACDLPALVHLDLWLGTPDYGGDAEIADLEPILSGARLPSLRHLALRNSEMQDQVAAAVAAAPVVARLETLDLSMGILTDDGAAALLTGQPLTHLKTLDLHYNYLTDPVRERLTGILAPAGVDLFLDGDDAEEEEDDDEVWRYVAVGE